MKRRTGKLSFRQRMWEEKNEVKMKWCRRTRERKWRLIISPADRTFTLMLLLPSHLLSFVPLKSVQNEKEDRQENLVSFPRYSLTRMIQVRWCRWSGRHFGHCMLDTFRRIERVIRTLFLDMEYRKESHETSKIVSWNRQTRRHIVSSVLYDNRRLHADIGSQF